MHHRFTTHLLTHCLPMLLARLSVLAMLAHAPAVLAQSAAALYDPEPPADAGYVRVIHAASDGPLTVLVDARPRIAQLARFDASEYMVLPAGKHTLVIQAVGKHTALVSLPLDVIGAHAMTLAFTTLGANAKPLVFEDKTGGNKLKANLTVYHLSEAAGPLDIMTADAKLTVFPALNPGASANRAVNPIPIELMATKSGTLSALTSAKVSMTAGGSYSILLLPDAGGKVLARSVQNKTERYTGK
jgi:alginate O-acetyltransferase complex protein AlgF